MNVIIETCDCDHKFVDSTHCVRCVRCDISAESLKAQAYDEAMRQLAHVAARAKQWQERVRLLERKLAAEKVVLDTEQIAAIASLSRSSLGDALGLLQRANASSPSAEAIEALEAGIQSAKTRPLVYRPERFAEYADDSG